MKTIVAQIGEKFDKAYLDAPLPAATLYEKMSFLTEKHERYPVENGEVSEQTFFIYHQNGSLLRAVYSGGDILKGSLIGSVSDHGELDFVYHHMNRDMLIKTGKCHRRQNKAFDGRKILQLYWDF